MTFTVIHLFPFADDKDDRLSEKVLTGLENIDDDLDQSEILLLKMNSNANEIQELGLKEFPAIIFYEEQVGKMFKGNSESHMFKESQTI